MRGCPIFVSFVGNIDHILKNLSECPGGFSEEDTENSGYGTWPGG